MKNVNFFRFSIFGIWVITLLVTLLVFIWSMISNEMSFSEIEDSMTLVMGVLTPQIGVMSAFFFGMDKSAQEDLINHEKSISALAMVMSLIYHVVFWSVLSFSVGLGYMGSTIDENASAALKIIGFLSILGLAPVAYLFSHSEKSSHNRVAKGL